MNIEADQVSNTVQCPEIAKKADKLISETLADFVNTDTTHQDDCLETSGKLSEESETLLHTEFPNSAEHENTEGIQEEISATLSRTDNVNTDEQENTEDDSLMTVPLILPTPTSCLRQNINHFPSCPMSVAVPKEISVQKNTVWGTIVTIPVDVFPVNSTKAIAGSIKAIVVEMNNETVAICPDIAQLDGHNPHKANSQDTNEGDNTRGSQIHGEEQGYGAKDDNEIRAGTGELTNSHRHPVAVMKDILRDEEMLKQWDVKLQGTGQYHENENRITEKTPRKRERPKRDESATSKATRNKKTNNRKDKSPEKHDSTEPASMLKRTSNNRNKSPEQNDNTAVPKPRKKRGRKRKNDPSQNSTSESENNMNFCAATSLKINFQPNIMFIDSSAKQPRCETPEGLCNIVTQSPSKIPSVDNAPLLTTLLSQVHDEKHDQYDHQVVSKKKSSASANAKKKKKALPKSSESTEKQADILPVTPITEQPKHKRRKKKFIDVNSSMKLQPQGKEKVNVSCDTDGTLPGENTWGYTEKLLPSQGSSANNESESHESNSSEAQPKDANTMESEPQVINTSELQSQDTDTRLAQPQDTNTKKEQPQIANVEVLPPHMNTTEVKPKDLNNTGVQQDMNIDGTQSQGLNSSKVQPQGTNSAATQTEDINCVKEEPQPDSTAMQTQVANTAQEWQLQDANTVESEPQVINTRELQPQDTDTRLAQPQNASTKKEQPQIANVEVWPPYMNTTEVKPKDLNNTGGQQDTNIDGTQSQGLNSSKVQPQGTNSAAPQTEDINCVKEEPQPDSTAMQTQVANTAQEWQLQDANTVESEPQVINTRELQPQDTDTRLAQPQNASTKKEQPQIANVEVRPPYMNTTEVEPKDLNNTGVQQDMNIDGTQSQGLNSSKVQPQGTNSAATQTEDINCVKEESQPDSTAMQTQVANTAQEWQLQDVNMTEKEQLLGTCHTNNTELEDSKITGETWSQVSEAPQDTSSIERQMYDEHSMGQIQIQGRTITEKEYQSVKAEEEEPSHEITSVHPLVKFVPDKSYSGIPILNHVESITGPVFNWCTIDNSADEHRDNVQMFSTTQKESTEITDDSQSSIIPSSSNGIKEALSHVESHVKNSGQHIESATPYSRLNQTPSNVLNPYPSSLLGNQYPASSSGQTVNPYPSSNSQPGYRHPSPNSQQMNPYPSPNNQHRHLFPNSLPTYPGSHGPLVNPYPKTVNNLSVNTAGNAYSNRRPGNPCPHSSSLQVNPYPTNHAAHTAMNLYPNPNSQQGNQHPSPNNPPTDAAVNPLPSPTSQPKNLNALAVNNQLQNPSRAHLQDLESFIESFLPVPSDFREPEHQRNHGGNSSSSQVKQSVMPFPSSKSQTVNLYPSPSGNQYVQYPTLVNHYRIRNTEQGFPSINQRHHPEKMNLHPEQRHLHPRRSHPHSQQTHPLSEQRHPHWEHRHPHPEQRHPQAEKRHPHPEQTHLHPTSKKSRSRKRKACIFCV